MKGPEGTSAVEGVGSREKGNIQTHGESNICEGQGVTAPSGDYTTTGGRTDVTTELGRDETTGQNECNNGQQQHRLQQRQKRAGQWRQRERVQAFKASAAKERLENAPTNDDLMKIADKECRLDHTPEERTEINMRQAQRRALQGNRAVKGLRTTAEWKRGGHGHIEDAKPNNRIRVLLENYNNLQYFTDERERRKINTIESTRRRLRADVTAGVETGVDWTLAQKAGMNSFHDLFGMGEDKKSACSHNVTEQNMKSQPGGTCMMAYGVFSSHVKNASQDPNKGKDKRGLGSYCSLVTTGKSAKPVRLVVYYRPNEESRHRTPKRGRQTVFAQHMREFKRKGMRESHPPSEADKCLLEDLRSWISVGEEIILLGDYNQNIYTSALAVALGGAGLEMKEQFHSLHGEQAPHSHMSGCRRPIMGCYATSGVEVKAYFISGHHAHGSVGDHRLHVIDFCAESILGEHLPTVTRRSGRKLQWKIRSARRKYTRDLVAQCRHHKLDEKSLRLRRPRDFKNQAEFRAARESFDKQHCELQLGCEERCRTYKTGEVEWSPLITTINKRLRIYRWIAGFKRGKKCNVRNLERACRNNLRDNKNDPRSKHCPWTMSLEEALQNAAACEKELDKLKKEAPSMRTEHIQRMLVKARRRKDKRKEKALLSMLRKEFDKKQN